MAEPMVQAVRGMNDILPPETSVWRHAEAIMRKVLQSHGYQEIRTPILEKTELFKRSLGEVTDIVDKEMYTFTDRNEESLTLRPEGTASCVRAGIEHGLLYNQIQRLWYLGPYFRHERPQKGRYRQFHQCGAEVFGLEGPDIDAELILMSAMLMEKIGISEHVTLEINSLGSPESRTHYRDLLIAYFEKNKASLDEDSQKRLYKNPLRILDSKNPALKSLIEKAPKLIDHLDAESQQHFKQLQSFLTEAGLTFTINPNLVRGLDYYTKTVFEWTTDKLGSQSAICSGGRYDLLVKELGGKSTPALGFGLGMERLISLMQQDKQIKKYDETPHIYLLTDSEQTFAYALKSANHLRNKVPGLRLIVHCGGGPIKNQFKKADKSGALYAIIAGEYELKNRMLTLKNLREDFPQQALFLDELAEYLKLKIKR